jgi:hypothetical protein
MMQDPMTDEYAAQTAYALRAGRRVDWPYPHVLVEGILPDPLFRSLRDAEIEPAVLDEHAHSNDATAAEAKRYSLSHEARDLAEGRVTVPEVASVYRVLEHPMVKHALVTRFAAELAKHLGAPRLAMSSTLTYIEDASGYELLPHTDIASKAITLLIYLADDRAAPELGTEIYVPRHAGTVLPDQPKGSRYRREDSLSVTTVPYRGNQGLAFAPASNTFHGVAPVTEGHKTRRLLQYQLLTNAERVVPAKGGA